MTQSFALELQGIQRTFTQGDTTLSVLKEVSLQVKFGEVVALVGPSGSGKSTLLQIAGLLEPASQGTVFINGQASHSMNEKQRTQLRGNTIGFVYQFHQLLPEFTALENVILPQLIQNIPYSHAQVQAQELLEKMQLGHRFLHRPKKLSGGEQQRVAIARALVNQPKLLLADEPTGNLDPQTAEQVFQQLLTLVRDSKLGALIATHNLELAEKMDRIVVLKEGRLY